MTDREAIESCVLFLSTQTLDSGNFKRLYIEPQKKQGTLNFHAINDFDMLPIIMYVFLTVYRTYWWSKYNKFLLAFYIWTNKPSKRVDHYFPIERRSKGKSADVIVAIAMFRTELSLFAILEVLRPEISTRDLSTHPTEWDGDFCDARIRNHSIASRDIFHQINFMLPSLVGNVLFWKIEPYYTLL